MIAFFAAVIVALAAILRIDPAVYTTTAPAVPPLAFFFAVTALVAVLVIGVTRRWRWTFWIVLLAFLAGALRIVASALELTGLVAATGPAWYVALQGVIGIVQLVIGIYQQTLGRDPEQAGHAFYVGELQAGRRTIQSIAVDVLNGATPFSKLRA